LVIQLRPTRFCSRPAIAFLGLVLCTSPAAEPPAHDIALVFDNSGSMKANDPEYMARTAARSFVEGFTGDLRLAVIIFDQKVSLAAPLTSVGDETRDELLASFEKVTYKGQYTQTAKALERAVYELRANGRKDARRSVIVFTDGIVDTNNKARDAESIKWMREDLAAEAADLGIRVYGIAFTENADVMTIQTLAKRTNAEYYRAPQPSDLARVFAQLNEVLQAPEPVPEPAPAALHNTALATPTPVLATTVPVELGSDAAPAHTPPATEVVANAADSQSAGVAAVTADVAQAVATTQTTTGVAVAAAPSPAVSSPVAVVVQATPPSTNSEQEQAPPASTATSIPTAASSEPAGKAAEQPTTVTVAQPSASAPQPAEAIDNDRRWMVIAAVALVLVFSIVALIVVLRRGRASSTGASATGGVPEGVVLEDLHEVTGQARHLLNNRLVIVGRNANPSADGLTQSIVIERTTIGRQHAVIEYRNNGFWLRDQKSLNGTFVNSKRIDDDEVLLKNGDVIQFYDLKFRFEMPSQDDSDHTVFAGATEDDLDRTVLAAPGDALSEDHVATKVFDASDYEDPMASAVASADNAEEHCATMIYEPSDIAAATMDSPDDGANTPAPASGVDANIDEASLATVMFEADDDFAQATDSPREGEATQRPQGIDAEVDPGVGVDEEQPATMLFEASDDFAQATGTPREGETPTAVTGHQRRCERRRRVAGNHGVRTQRRHCANDGSIQGSSEGGVPEQHQRSGRGVRRERTNAGRTYGSAARRRGRRKY
jgi:Mg-chelatase subunit ChlD